MVGRCPCCNMAFLQPCPACGLAIFLEFAPVDDRDGWKPKTITIGGGRSISCAALHQYHRLWSVLKKFQGQTIEVVESWSVEEKRAWWEDCLAAN